MIKKIIMYFLGYSVIRAEKKDAVAFVNTAVRLGLADSVPVNDAAGGVRLTVRASKVAAFTAKLDSLGIGYTNEKTAGFLLLLRSHADRAGLLVGAILSLVCFIISSRYVWGFEISGNRDVSDSEVIGILENAGFGIGTKYADIDIPQFQNDVILTTDKLAWVSVNMLGTLARVEVMEMNAPKKDDIQAECTNLVASEDGIVEYISEVSGQVAVKLGDFVRKGDLLISGIRTDKNGNLQFEQAMGSVKARVTRSFMVKIERTVLEKVYTGREKKACSVKIFSKNINLLRNGGNSYESYDIIDNNRQVVLFGDFSTPVFINETRYAEYEYTERELSGDEMVSYAMLEYASKLSEAVGQGELLSKEICSYYEDGAYVIECTLICLDEITRTVAVDIVR